MNGLCFPAERDGTIIFSGCRNPRHSFLYFTLYRRLDSLAVLAMEIYTEILTPSTGTFGTIEKEEEKRGFHIYKSILTREMHKPGNELRGSCQGLCPHRCIWCKSDTKTPLHMCQLFIAKSRVVSGSSPSSPQGLGVLSQLGYLGSR